MVLDSADKVGASTVGHVYVASGRSKVVERKGAKEKKEAS